MAKRYGTIFCRGEGEWDFESEHWDRAGRVRTESHGSWTSDTMGLEMMSRAGWNLEHVYMFEGSPRYLLSTDAHVVRDYEEAPEQTM